MQSTVVSPVESAGKADERAEAQASSSGAQGFVGKPFDLQQLIDQTKQIAPV